MAANQPVFFDPTLKRWRRVVRVATVIAVIMMVLLAAVMVAVTIRPGLPSLGLESGKVHVRQGNTSRIAAVAREARFEKARAALQSHLKNSLPPAPAAPHGDFERIAFYVNWDDNSWVSLKRNAANIDTLIAEWLHLGDAQGRILVDDVSKQQMALDYLRLHRPGMPVVALINNLHDESWDSTMLASMLADPEARTRCIDAIENFLVVWHLQGVNIDFEAVPPHHMHDLLLFMRELYARLHPLKLSVSQSVPVDDESFPFAELGKVTDYLMLMSYDEHASDNEAGPLASQEWFINSISKRTREVSPDKLVVGIGAYGNDWLHGGHHAEEVSFQDALGFAAEAEDDIELDAGSGNPFFTYVDEKNRRHDVWFLDAVTAFNQVQAAVRLNPRGFAVWRLGAEDPQLWQVLGQPAHLDAGVAASLQTVNFGYDLDYEGKGEILRVAGTPVQGWREVGYDPDIGMLTDNQIKTFPRGYVIQRWGFNKDKAIALTFDDGPDAQFTPAILEILKQKNVPATFFVIGENAEANPELLDRLYAEGHEIGNHTYTHPNIADVSEARTALELNATQRLLESRLGHRSLLFRPPYAEDVEPETPDQVRPLVFTSSLGYYSVGLQIDPDDWKRPPADEIIKRVLAQAAENQGNVVLLHDGGGDRSATVAALPKLIDALRAHGYRFVTIAQLLGKTRADVMPQVQEKGELGLWLEAGGFVLINDIGRTLRALFFVGIGFGLARFVLVAVLALLRGRRHRHSPALPAAQLVSVVVPAYNEEQLVCRTISTLLASAGVNVEVIVVDDGSTDATAARVHAQFGNDARVQLVTQANSGKAEALNHGMRLCRGDIVVALDADTLFTPHTIGRLVRHFADANVGAVAGNAKVGNRINLLTRWQALEYITSQNLDRRAFEKLNCITVVPGAVGAWRKQSVLDAGGFKGDTLAEDADLTMRIVRNGFRIVYEPQAHAYTEAPQTFGSFVKQRFRWMYGTLQACWKHRDVLLRRKGGTLGLVALPNVLIFQIAFPLISPIMDFTMLWTTLEALLNYAQHPAAGMSSAFWHSLYFYGLFLALDMVTALVAYLFEPEEDWRLLPWLPLQRFCYRQLMYYVAIRSFVAALRGPHVGWGKLQRYGSATADRQ